MLLPHDSIQTARHAARRPRDPDRRAAPGAAQDPIARLVARLDLEQYKATIKGLTQFGDRRQGTDRNRAAVNWIEAQLKSYGCSDVARLKYEYQPQPPNLGPRQTRDT